MTDEINRLDQSTSQIGDLMKSDKQEVRADQNHTNTSINDLLKQMGLLDDPNTEDQTIIKKSDTEQSSPDRARELIHAFVGKSLFETLEVEDVKNPDLNRQLETFNNYFKNIVENKINNGIVVIPENITHLISDPAFLTTQQREVVRQQLSSVLSFLKRDVPTDLQDMLASYMKVLEQRQEIRWGLEDLDRQKRGKGLRKRDLSADQARKLKSEHERKVSASESLKVVQSGLQELVDFAVTNGIDPVTFDHIPSVVDPSAYEVLEETAEIPKTWEDVAEGYADRSTGKVKISFRRRNDGHTFLHESIHRAALLKQNLDNLSSFISVIAEVGEIPVMKNEKDELVINPGDSRYGQVPDSDRDAAINADKLFLMEDSRILIEGLTEGTALEANHLHLTRTGNALHESFSGSSESTTFYPAERKIYGLFGEALQNQGLTESQSRAYLIACGLTGNVRELVSKAGGNEEFDALMRKMYLHTRFEKAFS